MIKVITFDFWDTIVADGSDEPLRKEKGLPSKKEEKISLLTGEIRQYHPELTEEQIAKSFKEAEEWNTHSWKVEYRTHTVATRIAKVYEILGIEPTAGFDGIVEKFENMEVEIPPLLNEGAAEIIPQLASQYTLGIISDTITTPGTGIKKLLEHYGLLEYFKIFVFSDEIGFAKPHPRVFEIAQEQAGVPFEEMVHVGDRESNDIAGPLKIGMKAILYTWVVDRGSEKSQASAVCTHYRELPDILKKL